MTYTVFFLTTRASGISIEQFKDHYENKHVPLVTECLGDALPLSHTRYYLKRNDATHGNDNVAPPLVFLGDVDSVDYDCLTIIEFRDVEHFGRFNQAFETSPRKAELEADQQAFADPSKLRIIAVEGARTSKF